ncbi:hypothetical protein [Pararhizobium sp.]|uniref:hypothetical protein n=1 Tax=Pararhizobium sp. TaxID=1977563 RepID=UPI002727F809|nr:hypothetical protein [Pararhizobium sp.]MDO9417050.1 hypothetical protein [Pararhizobium sp.]
MVERSWLWRRWAVFSSLAVCDLVIVYLTVFGADTRLNQDIVNSAFLLIGIIANGYVFGGVLDDRNKDKAAVTTQALDQSGPTTANVSVEQQ